MKETKYHYSESEISWPSDERMAEVRAMLAANPRIRRMDELSAIRKQRSLTAEEKAEYEEIMRPFRERQALPDGFYD